MRITELLNKDAMDLNATPKSKAEAIALLVDLMVRSGNILDKEEYKKCVLKRETIGSTGIGEGVAIPHAKTKAVKSAGLAVIVVRDGVDFDSLDGEPAKLFFLIAAPDTEDNIHLDVLGRLSVLLMDDDFRQGLIDAKDKEEFFRLVDEAENKKVAETEKKEEEAKKAAPGTYRILAVTACPTGIAHTYMAAESLEEKAKQMGVTIKVETNGSGGKKNVLTQAEIAAADGIIVAADTKVDMPRFDGKPVVQTQVSDGISRPQELIQTILDGKAPVFHAQGGHAQAETGTAKEGIGHQIYKHLMNGVSNMLPFVIGGGILIAIAFLLDTILAPGGDPANFGMNSPAAALFKTIGNAAFGFMLPILAGFISMSIADRPGLAVGFVGGALANAGGSGFLGALIAGFIAGYLMLGL